MKRTLAIGIGLLAGTLLVCGPAGIPYVIVGGEVVAAEKVTVKIREGIIGRSIRAEMVGSSVSGRHCAFPPLP